MILLRSVLQYVKMLAMERKDLAISLISSVVSASEQVICIHGFMGWKTKMLPLARPLSKMGHFTHIWGYPSREKTTEQHALDLVDYLWELVCKKPGVKINFVTHSYGALIVREALNHPRCPKEAKAGRAVLVAPPNQGCQFGKRLSRLPLLKTSMGKHAGKELIENASCQYGHFPPLMKVLVIAGISSINPLLKAPNDGLLKIEETKLTTPHEHLIVEANHDAILTDCDTIGATTQFFAICHS